MAWTEIYVDPSIAGDSGTGVIGDPYGDLEYAIEQETFDLTEGTRVNVKAGTAEVLADGIDTAMDDTSVSIAWAPAAAKPMLIQGYTAVAGDGGVAEINGNGSHGLMGAASKAYCGFLDLYVHNCGAQIAIKGAASCAAIRCKVEDSTGNGIQFTNYGVALQNYVLNVGGTGIQVGATGHTVAYNVIEDGANTMTTGISTFGGACYRNIIIVGAASSANGIQNQSSFVSNNSIYSLGSGTGIGIYHSGARLGASVNNLIEGFSGVGGNGIEGQSTAEPQQVSGNAIFNCTTPYTYTHEPWDSDDNETLTESPFTDAAAGDFSPVETGNLKEGSLPETWNN